MNKISSLRRKHTWPPPEGQSDTAPSDSTIEHNVTEISAVETVPVPPISRYPQRITRPPERYM